MTAQYIPPPLSGYRLISGETIQKILALINPMNGYGAPQPGAFSALTGLAPTSAGAALTVTAANAMTPILLNNATGSVVTLPPATGSGNVYNFVVTATTTSNAHKVLAASTSDNLIGFVTGENGGTPKCFTSASGTGNHSLQMPYTGSQPSGGFQGDWFDFVDVAPNTWQVTGFYQAGTTPTTPFSTADS